jgi:hypothetical protein
MKKIRGINQLGSKYTYTWKYHKEIPCVAIFTSNKQKCHFFLFFFFFNSKKMENRRAEQVLPKDGGRGLEPKGGGR